MKVQIRRNGEGRVVRWWESEEFPERDRTPRCSVWLGVSWNVTVFVFTFLLLPNILASPHKGARAVLRSCFDSIEAQIVAAHLEEEAYPPGETFAGNIRDVPSLWDRLEYKPLLDPFARLAVYERTRSSWAIPALALALIILIVISRPLEDRLLAHLGQGGSSLLLIPVLMTTGSLLYAVVSHAPGALIGAVYLLVRRGPDCERRLASFFPLAFLIFLCAWVIQERHIANLSEEEQTRSYRYVTDGKTDWLLQSTGPDATYELDFSNWPKASPEETDAEQWLRFIAEARTGRHTYDPTNGTTSGGDLFRFPHPEER